MSRDTLQVIADEALQFFSFVNDALDRGPEGKEPSIFERAVRSDLGLKPPVPGRGPTTSAPGDRLEAIRAYRDAADPGVDAGIQAVADIAVCIDHLASVLEAFFDDGDFEAGAGVQQLVDSAIEVLGTNYVRLRWPRLFLLFQAVALLEDIGSTYGLGSNNGVRLGRAFATLFGFLFAPGKTLEQLDPSGRALPDYTAMVADFSVRVAAIIVSFLDRKDEIAVVRDILTGWDGPGVDVDDPRPPTRADVISQRMTSIAFGGATREETGEPTAGAGLVITTAMVPKDEGGTALFLAFGGNAEVAQPLGDRWTFSAKVRSDAGVGVLLSFDDVDVVGPGSGGTFQASTSFTSHPPLRAPDEPAPATVSFSFPSAKGSRIDFGQVAFGLSLGSAGAEMLLTLADSALIIDAADNDGLIAELLGKTPLRLPFHLVLGYSSERGFVREGGIFRDATSAQPAAPLGGGVAGADVIDATIPVGRAFGPVTVHEIALRIGRGPADAEEKTLLRIEADASFSMHIGPVYVRLDQLGLNATTDSGMPRAERNLGFVDLSLGAKFPRGVAINVETSVIAGGGTILHDPAQGLYFGTIDLAIRGGTSVQAIGLITTRNPDGSKGFSMLLILTIELARPWPIGLGFFIEGAGAMIAVHRTFDEAAMRAALPSGQLRHVLFPADPVHRSAELLEALKRLFPVRRGSFMIGALVKIGWADPTLIRMELALIYEWGHQNRLILLGRVSAALPRPDEAIIKINMDAVGILDFDAGTFELDAVLYDSKLCGRFVLTGAMAMRLAWEGERGFALSVGGLHPRFRVPPRFPTVARLQIALTHGDNPSLICRAYFAVTSNTVQFGADCTLYAAAWGFSVQGNVGFDVLIQLLPFHFLAEFRASVQLKRGSKNLFKVSLSGELEGPLPLRIAGKASFEILWCDFSVSFDRTLVDGGAPNDLLPIDVLAELFLALSSPQAWQAALPAGAGQVVSVRQPAGDGVLLHPLGSLTVRQQVVPLGLTRDIDRVGTGTPTGVRRFAITGAEIGPVPQTRAPVNEPFAPAQFFDMSDDDRLTAPSFESMEAGVTLGEAGYAFDFATVEASPFDYTDIVIDKNGKPVLQDQPHTPDPAQVLVLAAVGAAGRARIRRSLTLRFEAPVLSDAPRLKPGGWAAVELDSPAPPEVRRTWVEARALAADRTRFVVMPVRELVQ